ncbi:glycosyltransferase family 9 protein [Mycobacterium seoulense]|uniref:glycosyltransferase family 9 protein n=1 Tax=Mycobacterium seoulense TaxID=386911 RepID=UPI003CE8F397
MSEITVQQGEHSPRLERSALDDVLRVDRPAVYLGGKIGEAIVTLPTVRALSEMFTAPLTLVCPKFIFDLCLWEVSPRLIDITGSPAAGVAPRRIPDYGALAAEVGGVDVFINTVPWNLISNSFVRPLREALAPRTSIGFKIDHDSYDIVAPKDVDHAADLIFNLARLFDPSARIETYAQPVPVRPMVREKARSIRAAVTKGTRVLVVHADTDWAEKRWPITRFIDLLDRFLSRRRDFVAWIVGMGHEELNVGNQRDRVISYLGLPLDLTMGLVANADLFVGVDSSMLHAADLARVPGVGLFGPTRPATWGFRFAPHRHVDVKTMADITVDEVLRALTDLADEHA